MKKAIIGASMVLAASQAAAADTYFGIGFGDADYDQANISADVYLAFMGKSLPDVGSAKAAVEAAIYRADADNGSSSGISVAYVLGVPVADQFSILGRVGLDTNPDMDKLFFGVGASFDIQNGKAIRLDYTMGETYDGGGGSDDVDTISVSLVFNQ